jgi:hypothetical protein
VEVTLVRDGGGLSEVLAIGSVAFMTCEGATAPSELTSTEGSKGRPAVPVSDAMIGEGIICAPGGRVMDDGSSGVAVSLSLCLVRLVFLERGGDFALGILFGGLFYFFTWR